MLQAKKRAKESTSNLVRRFMMLVRQSGIMERARAKMFYQHPKTKRQLKKEALYKQSMRKQYDKLRKLGKLEEKDNKHSFK